MEQHLAYIDPRVKLPYHSNFQEFLACFMGLNGPLRHFRAHFAHLLIEDDVLGQRHLAQFEEQVMLLLCSKFQVVRPSGFVGHRGTRPAGRKQTNKTLFYIYRLYYSSTM